MRCYAVMCAYVTCACLQRTVLSLKSPLHSSFDKTQIHLQWSTVDLAVELPSTPPNKVINFPLFLMHQSSTFVLYLFAQTLIAAVFACGCAHFNSISPSQQQQHSGVLGVGCCVGSVMEAATAVHKSLPLLALETFLLYCYSN